MSVMHRVAQRPGEHDPDFVFWCPGCKFGHGVWVTTTCKKTGAQWKWNGSETAPSFTPSILITEGGICCHSYVTDGFIHFGSDCTHALAGTVVKMQEEFYG